MIVPNPSVISTRWHRPSDLPELEQLFAVCFPREQWTQQDFLDFINRQSTTNVLKVLAHREGYLFGALLYTLEPGQCRIRRIAVDPHHRRFGLGTYLLYGLVGHQSPIRRARFTAHVHEDCVDGQLFFRDAKIGTRQMQMQQFEFNAAVRRRYDDGTQGLVFGLHKELKPVRRLVAA